MIKEEGLFGTVDTTKKWDSPKEIWLKTKKYTVYLKEFKDTFEYQEC